jgi:chromosome segregation ATPase
MSTMETPTHPDAAEPTVRITPRRARIDTAHPVVSSSPPGQQPRDASEPPATEQPPLAIEEPSADLLAAIAGLSPAARREQLELEAAQLGDYLRERLREVDRREAQVNARAAQLEADVRAGRVWMSDRQQEFQEREAQLRQQIEDLKARGSSDTPEQSGDGQDLDEARQELVERKSQLQLKENDLRERLMAADRHVAALRHAQQTWEQERNRQEAELARERDRLAANFRQQSAERDQQLAEAEKRLVEQAGQLEQSRADLAADRQAWEKRRQVQAAALDERARSLEAEHDDRRQRLDARAQWVDEQKIGLEQVRGEILGLHRQVLESRLLGEQLWSQITGRMAAAEATQQIAQLRLKLIEHYKLEEQSLDQRRRELVQLGERIGQQHRELMQLREGLKGWASTRQAEIESQAAHLVQRELAFDEQLNSLGQERRKWESQRRDLERQISELTTQLRSDDRETLTSANQH